MSSVFAALAFSLTFVIWPHPAGAPVPPAGLMPVFIGLGIVDALAFGVGVAFLIFGFPVLARIGGTGPLTWAAYLGIGWSLVSWWPHLNMRETSLAQSEDGAEPRLEHLQQASARRPNAGGHPRA